MTSFFQNRNFLGILKICRCGGFVFLALSLSAVSSFGTGINTDPLSSKLTQLLEMHQKASTKRTLAHDILEQVNHQMDALKQEILEIRQRKKIVSYDKAVRSARIKFNLLLMGRLQAYGTGLGREIEKLEEARATLDFLCQMMEDDLKIIETLNHMESAEHIKQIEKTMRAYGWLNQKYLLTAKGMIPPEPRKIWQHLIIKEVNGQKGKS